MFVVRAAVCAASLVLSSCAALNYIHDPQSGLITRTQVPKLLQSVRCELVTFYEANRARQKNFTIETNKKNPNRDFAIRNYAFFPLDEAQLGAVFLGLKVTDNLSIPASPASAFDAKYSTNRIDTRTWHVGPSVSGTNTYELNWPFVIPQNAKLDLTQTASDEEESGTNLFPCYRFGSARVSAEGLARQHFPQTERFERMYVNGTEPLASWLLDVGSELGTAFFAKKRSETTEKIFPAQMIYTFTVQAGIGADLKFSLLSSRWNPAAIDLSGSTQQLSTLTFYVNGYDSKNANGAKTGIAQFPGSPDNMVELNGLKIFGPSKTKCPAELPELCSGGTLTYPLPILPP